jgi:hypothetical protein
MSSALPKGWVQTPMGRARRFLDELQRELSRDHALSGVLVEALADRDGASDDVLFRRFDNPARFAVVDLTWRGSTEIDPRWPHVVFEGTFEEFVAYEGRHHALEPSTE